MNHNIQTSKRSPRRGTMYLAVLGTALIVSTMAMAAMVSARLDLRQANANLDLDHARCLAQSALELGLANTLTGSNWRNTIANNTEKPTTPLDFSGTTSDKGKLTYKLVDEKDADLADDPSDPARLYGIGRVGEADYVMSVLLEPIGAALTCLEASFHTDGQITFNGCTWTTNQFVSTNKSGSDVINRSGSGVLNGNAEAVGTIQGSAVNGSTSPSVAARQMPDPARVFEYYLTNGTWIDFNDLPAGSPRMLEKVVLSPGNNPYGTGITNPQGIYVIDCKNQAIRVKLVRLLGTLVLLNPGSGSDLDNDQHWEPAARNLPVLMVQGDIKFNWHSDHTLRESMAGVNYNPAHTPYLGISDTDQVDEYPGLIKGLVYVSGLLDVQHECAVEGVVVTGTVNAQDDMTLTYDRIFLDNPPPGFRAAVPAGATNLLTNGGFESGTGSWTGSNCSISPGSMGDSHSGTGYLVATSITQPNYGPVQNITSVLQNGKSYDVEVWMKTVLGSANISVMLETTASGSGTQTFTLGPTNVGSSTYTKLSGTLTPTWSGTLTNALFCLKNPTSFSAYKIDDAVLNEQGAGGAKPTMQISPGSWRREVSQ